MSKSLIRSFNRSIPIIRRGLLKVRTTGNNKKMEPRYDYNRKWMLTSKNATQMETEDRKPLPSFKLLSYNILAQDLLLEHLHLYLNIRQECLSWRQRMQNLLREIIKLDPDILCLQEMQYDHLPMFVQSLTARSGKRLEYVYKKKTGSRTDGCAIIYDSCKFQLLCHQPVELYDASVPLLNRENVALFAKFRLRQPGSKDPREMIVATTHLLYNPRRNDVRCAQVHKLLTELKNFSQLSTPVILTGDFNSQVNSPPMAMLTTKDTDNSSLNLKVLELGEYRASTYQDNWITVDFILHSNSPQSKYQLQPLSIYALPTLNCCAAVGQIPNHYLGSDHYVLGSIFALV